MAKISDAEWDIMKLLWKKSPVTAQDLIKELDGLKDWKPKTVKSYLNRLLNKEVVGFEQKGKTYFYYPLVDEEVCIKEESKSFLKRIYGGALDMMIANFIETEELSNTDIEKLKSILDNKKDKR